MRTCTIIKRVLRGIRFSIALKEKSYAFLVWSVRVESRHNHDLPWQIPHEAGRAEDWLTQPVEAFNCKLKCCFWSPTCICNTHTQLFETPHVLHSKMTNIMQRERVSCGGILEATRTSPSQWTTKLLTFQFFPFEKRRNPMQANRALQDVFLLYTISLNVSLAVGFVTTPVSSKAADAARQRHQMLYN